MDEVCCKYYSSNYHFFVSRATQVLRTTGKKVTLLVAKQAAQYYGIAHILQQCSPRYNKTSEWQYIVSYIYRSFLWNKICCAAMGKLMSDGLSGSSQLYIYIYRSFVWNKICCA